MSNSHIHENMRIHPVKLFKALADKKRLMVLKYLENNSPISVSEISCKLKLPLKTTSRILLKLQAVGLVNSERYKRKVLYSIAKKEKEFIGDILQIVKKYIF